MIECMYMPDYLYKILSYPLWEQSQGKDVLLLPKDDDAFIHFSTKEQLDRIIAKYWADVSEYVILTIETKKLPGEMRFEVNPGGTAKYYHLYNGSIPFAAIVASTVYSKDR